MIRFALAFLLILFGIGGSTAFGQTVRVPFDEDLRAYNSCPLRRLLSIKKRNANQSALESAARLRVGLLLIHDI